MKTIDRNGLCNEANCLLLIVLTKMRSECLQVKVDHDISINFPCVVNYCWKFLLHDTAPREEQVKEARLQQ